MKTLRARATIRAVMPHSPSNRRADIFPSEDEITQFASELFFESGRRCYADCYRLAEHELLERAAKRAMLPAPSDRRRKRPR